MQWNSVIIIETGTSFCVSVGLNSKNFDFNKH